MLSQSRGAIHVSPENDAAVSHAKKPGLTPCCCSYCNIKIRRRLVKHRDGYAHDDNMYTTSFEGTERNCHTQHDQGGFRDNRWSCLPPPQSHTKRHFLQSTPLHVQAELTYGKLLRTDPRHPSQRDGAVLLERRRHAARIGEHPVRSLGNRLCGSSRKTACVRRHSGE